MQSSNKPKNLTVPFASGGAYNAIPTDSQVTVSPGKASYTDGFPPATRTPRAAGGIPPDGLDMNGILHDLSNAVMYQQAFGIMPWDSDFASVTGYPKNAIVSYNGLLYQSLNDDNKALPTNATAWSGIKSVTPMATANDNQVATMAALQTAINGVKGSASLAANGWEIMPSGLIRQWGSRSVSGSGARSDSFNFPIAFTSAVFQVRASDTGNLCIPLGAGGNGLTGATVYVPAASLGDSTTPAQTAYIGYVWEAIGY